MDNGKKSEKGNFYSTILFFVISYIPLWIGISLIWSIFDKNHIDFREYLIIQLLIVISFIMLFKSKKKTWWRQKTSKKITPRKMDYGFLYPIRSTIKKINDYIFNIRNSKKTNDVDKILVRGYGQVKPCCYNAARLKDTYCMCGRTIPSDLIDYIDGSTLN